MEDFKKVKAPMVGADGNVYNLICICQRALKNEGYRKEADELFDKVTHSHSYDEALQIMMEYVDPVDQNYGNYDENINI